MSERTEKFTIDAPGFHLEYDYKPSDTDGLFKGLGGAVVRAMEGYRENIQNAMGQCSEKPRDTLVEFLKTTPSTIRPPWLLLENENHTLLLSTSTDESGEPTLLATDLHPDLVKWLLSAGVVSYMRGTEEPVDDAETPETPPSESDTAPTE